MAVLSFSSTALASSNGYLPLASFLPSFQLSLFFSVSDQFMITCLFCSHSWPLASLQFTSIIFQSTATNHHHVFQPPLSTMNPTVATTSSTAISAEFSFSSLRPLDDHLNDLVSLQNRRYDFAPLLRFLSNSSAYATMASTPNSNSDSSSPNILDPAELQLAESYRAVPAPLWHALLKSLCSSSTSIGLAYAVVSWLQKHKLCFSYELLYSILIHSLGRSEKLYEAFLLS